MTPSLTRRLPYLVGVSCVALIMTWTLLVTPRYRSTALLRVEEDTPTGGLEQAISAMPGADLLGLSRDQTQSEVGVLQSRRVLDAVIDSLGLMVRRSSGARSAVVAVAVVGEADTDGRVRINPTADGRWQLHASLGTPWWRTTDVSAILSRGDTIRVGGIVLRLLPDSATIADGRPVHLRLRPRHEVLERLEDRLQIRRAEIGSQLISIVYEDSDRELAAGVVRRILAEYLVFSARAERGDLGSTAEELRRQVARQREALGVAEEALRRHQERTGLVLPEEQATAQIKRYATVRVELDAAEAERSALARMLALTEARAGAVRSPAVYRQLATYPTLIANRAIQDLLESLLSLENTRSEKALVLADDSRELRQLTTRIGEIETSLQRLGTQYLEAVGIRSRALAATIDSIDRELDILPREELQYVRLLRDRTILNEGYLLLLKQLRQVELRDALRLDRVRVIDTPTVAHPDDPAFPKVWVHFVLALVIGAAAGYATWVWGQMSAGGPSGRPAIPTASG